VDPSGGLFADPAAVCQVLRVLGVHQIGEVAAVVENHVEGFAVGEDERLLDAPDVLLVGLALPGVDGDPRLGDSRRRVILGAEDVAT
jgi:hypothetical protein